MISTGQIIAAGVITGLAVALAAAVARWSAGRIVTSSLGAAVLMVAWRAASNLLNLNGDFLPAISVGDTACLFVGAAAPALVAATQHVPARLRWVPAAAGGLAGFAVNVIIL